VMALLKDYSPKDLYRVDAIMEQDMDEAALMADVRSKYCEYTRHTGGSGPVKDYDSEARDKLRTRLTAFYRRNSPDEMHKVDKAVDMNETEKALFESLYKTYPGSANPPVLLASTTGVALPPAAAANDFRTHTGGSGPVKGYTGELRERLKTRLTAFYQRFNPEEMQKAEKALGMGVTEEALFKKLFELYPAATSTEAASTLPWMKDNTPTPTLNPTPPLQAAVTPTTQPALAWPDYHVATGHGGLISEYSGDARDALRARLTSFYRVANPQEMLEKTAKALTLPVSEAELFTKLFALYPEMAMPRADPNPSTAAAPAPTANDFRTHTGGSGPVKGYTGELRERLMTRLTAFYQRFNPAEGREGAWHGRDRGGSVQEAVRAVPAGGHSRGYSDSGERCCGDCRTGGLTSRASLS
jgi:hypothetical protein